MWLQRGLSLKGKIAVLRSIGIPQMLYITSCLYTPAWVIEKVDSIFFSFIWPNKKHHVKKETIIGEISKGGIKMPHFESIVKGVKFSWIKRLIQSERRHEFLIRLIYF